MNKFSLNKFDLTGKCALITGAAGLLGIQHSTALLEAGAKVVLTDLNVSALAKAVQALGSKFAPAHVMTQVMDVTQEQSIQATAQTLSDQGFRVDILVNNAAIDPKVKADECSLAESRLEGFSIDSWNLQLNVGLTGAFLCSKVFGSAMAEDQAGGVILNIASDLSVMAPDQRLYTKEGLPPGQQPVKPVTYSVIKAGLIGLTRYLSTYWTGLGIRCNALSPGGVLNQQNDEFLDKVTQLIPMGRLANPDEYKSAIQFLCSDASAYMNGQNIVIDGGRSVW